MGKKDKNVSNELKNDADSSKRFRQSQIILDPDDSSGEDDEIDDAMIHEHIEKKKYPKKLLRQSRIIVEDDTERRHPPKRRAKKVKDEIGKSEKLADLKQITLKESSEKISDMNENEKVVEPDNIEINKESDEKGDPVQERRIKSLHERRKKRET